MPARKHIPFFYVISGIYAYKAQLKTNLWVSARPISSQECLWVLSQNPFVKRVCNAQRKKNAKKKRTNNGLTYLGGGGVHLFSCDGFTEWSSLFSSSTTLEPYHSRFRFESMDTDKPPPLEIKALSFFVSNFRLSKLSNPRLAFSGSTT
jgi:hypothetical protein